jgi:hypothetical protein
LDAREFGHLIAIDLHAPETGDLEKRAAEVDVVARGACQGRAGEESIARTQVLGDRRAEVNSDEA